MSLPQESDPLDVRPVPRDAAGGTDGGADSTRPRILVVDDNERNLVAIESVVAELADVVTVRSGEEALRRLLKGEFAVILLDVLMPGMDGYETAQMIRQRKQSRRTPIIFMSAVNKEKDHLIRGYSLGAVDYVFKPVEPIVLRSKVGVFVDLYEKRREVQRKAAHEQELLDLALQANRERLRVEQALRIAEQRQAAIIESLPILLYLEPADAIAHIPKFVGGDFAALTGFSLDTLQTNPDLWRERMHPEDRERVSTMLAQRRQAVPAIEYRWMCADGRYKHFLDHAVLLRRDDGEPIQFAGTVLDISDKKRLETHAIQTWKMDAVGGLTGGIAHDFNNLLTAILGGLSLLQRRVPLTEEQLKIVKRTERAAEQGSELVRRLLAFARRQQLLPARIDVTHLSTAVQDLLAHTLGGLVHIDWSTDAGLWSPYADGSQLELALVNLIINARDALPDGGTIRVRGENRISDGSGEPMVPAGKFVVLRVEDDGEGIPTSLLQKVMDPFFTTKDIGKGTGLGLSMVYGFANQSGGAIRIESELGRGTTVELWLPKAPEDEVLPKREPVRARDTSAVATPLRIVLVDDHPGVRVTTAALLDEMGHAVTEADNGSELLALLRKGPQAFDLLISDYAMPGMSGTELIRQVRGLCPGLSALIITGYAEVEMLGARPPDVPVLLKPFDVETLAAAIGQALRDTARIAV